MPTEFKLPELGENITTGDVLRVLVAPGDTIAKDQPVLELETDKATIEVPSSVAGRVGDIKVKAGDKVSVGQVILTVEDGAGAKTDGSGRAAPAARGPAEEAKEAEEAEEAKEAEEEPQQRQPPAARTAAPEDPGGEDAKARMPASGPQPQGASRPSASPAPKAPEAAKATGTGSVSSPAPERRATPERRSTKQDEPEPAEEAPRESASRGRRGEVVDISRGSRAAPEAEPPPAESEPATPAGPSVRRLARELGIDIDEVPGSGPAGRISIDDVKTYARRVITTAAAGKPAGHAAALPDFSKWGEVERKAMSGIRRKTAEHLSQAWNAIPHVTQHDRADITNVEEFRKRFEKTVQEAGGSLTVTAIALKVVAAALRIFPHINASVDLAAEEIVYKKYVHIGVAVDTDRGLLVPVIRDVDRKSILQLSIELTEAAEKARNRKTTLDELQGGSFTITNLGGIGGTAFSPIVNAPEVAILGLSRASMQPVFVEGRFEPRLMLPLSLSYDHRVVDGADAIRFLRWVADAFEQPFLLALQG